MLPGGRSYPWQHVPKNYYFYDENDILYSIAGGYLNIPAAYKTSDGNGNNACVHYSKCSYDYSKFTCVLHPNY